MKPSPVLKRVVDGGLCSGCGGCAAIAPKSVCMGITEKGFLRPRQLAEVTPDREGRIADCCPGTGLTQAPGDREDHPLWGPFVEIRSGYSSNPALRHHASSGGGLSAILTHLLRSGTVDAVLQTAAASSLPIGNQNVVSTTAEDIFAAAGSRYAPSAPLAGLDGVLAEKRRFAFVGKPCDVAALRIMGRTDARISERFPVMVSFFCAGVPSLFGARKILEKMGVDEGDVTAFKYRGDGWPGFATATLRDGSRREMSYSDSWGGILSNHVQLRCRICPDGTGGFADIACADAWETDEKGYPRFEERDGVSLIVSRTWKGETIVKQAIDAGELVAEISMADQIYDMQPGQRQRRQLTLPRVLAMRLMGRPIPVYRGFHLLRNTAAAGLTLAARNFVGTVWRIATNRLQL